MTDRPILLDKSNQFQGMARSLSQWEKMNPEAVLQGSDAQVRYALADAKHDIALLARLLSCTITEWQTIETAPKDGTWIFLYVPGHGPARARWRDQIGGCWEAHSTGKQITKGTHWLHLPNPPRSARAMEPDNG